MKGLLPDIAQLVNFSYFTIESIHNRQYEQLVLSTVHKIYATYESIKSMRELFGL
jgi:hypothetical protein